jgi:hypothetical protein
MLYVKAPHCELATIFPNGLVDAIAQFHGGFRGSRLSGIRQFGVFLSVTSGAVAGQLWSHLNFLGRAFFKLFSLLVTEIAHLDGDLMGTSQKRRRVHRYLTEQRAFR